MMLETTAFGLGIFNLRESSIRVSMLFDYWGFRLPNGLGITRRPIWAVRADDISTNPASDSRKRIALRTRDSPAEVILGRM